MSRKPLVIAFISDVAGAMIGVEKLAEGVASIDEAAVNSNDALKTTEAALRALGVRSERVAEAQIARLQEKFEQVRDSGVASAEEIARAQESMEARIAQINESIGNDTETVWEKIVAIIEAGTQSVGAGAVSLLQTAAKGIVAGVVATASAGALALAGGGTANIFNQADRADNMIKLARSTNTEIETLSAYSLAAEQSAVDTALLSTAFKGLRQNVDAAKDGKPDALLKRLGISVKGASGESRKFDAVLLDVVDKLSQVKDEGLRASLAAEAFGAKAGPGMASFIELGREGLEGYVKTAKDFGLVVTEETAIAAEAFNDRFDDLKQRFTGIRAQIAEPFFQPFADGFTKLGEFIDGNKQKLLDFGRVVSERILSVFEDVLSVFDGRDGDVKNGWVLQMRDAMVNLYTVTVDLLIPALETMLDLMNRLTSAWTSYKGFAADMGAAAGNFLSPVDPLAPIVAQLNAASYLDTQEGKAWQSQQRAGTPVNLTIENRTYAMTAPADVADALAKDQNAKALLRPTNPSKASR